MMIDAHRDSVPTIQMISVSAKLGYDSQLIPNVSAKLEKMPISSGSNSPDQEQPTNSPSTAGNLDPDATVAPTSSVAGVDSGSLPQLEDDEFGRDFGMDCAKSSNPATSIGQPTWLPRPASSMRWHIGSRAMRNRSRPVSTTLEKPSRVEGPTVPVGSNVW